MTQFARTFHFMKTPWVILSFTALAILSYLFIDRSLATYLHQLDLRTNIHALSVLTAFGQWTAYIVLFFLAALYFRFIRINSVYESKAWYLFGCVLIANLVCLVLKISLSRARPDLLFTSNEYGFYWFKLKSTYWSFPSGHTTTVVSLAVGLGVLIPRYFYLFLCMALFVGVTRVLLYYHYLSDVMVGFYLSLMVVGLFTKYLESRKK